MGLFVCINGCASSEYTVPTVALTLTALPIAKALKLPGHLERLVDFVEAEIERDKKLKRCRECDGEMVIAKESK